MSRDASLSGVILYGPPASGKDTLTTALTNLDSRYELYPRLKVGPKACGAYREASSEQLAGLRTRGQLLFENQRYGNTYGVDAPYVTLMLERGAIPVIHVGQTAGVHAVTRFPARWLTVALWCSRATTEARARARGSTDVDARLAAWDETASDLAAAEDDLFAMTILTDRTTPEESAAAIHDRMALAAPDRA